MTPEQKFFFDLNGWIMIPAVLTDLEITVMKQEVAAGAKQAYRGELQTLLDHDGIVHILTEILALSPDPAKDSYGFRCEHSHVSVRPPGWQDDADFRGTNVPHVVAAPQQANAMRYQVAGGKIYSGLTRVVWELEEVKSASGGTTFLSGSHKAHFNCGGPDPYSSNTSDSSWKESVSAAMVGYSCPPGSVVVFTESLLHASNAWTNTENPRCAVFNSYNSLWAQWHKPNLDHETIENMPAKRRTLFRGVWQLGGSQEYSRENSAVSYSNL